jgi:lysine 2,3-aminomutase
MATISQRPLPWKHVSPADWSDWRWQLQHSMQGLDALVGLLRERGISADRGELERLVSRYRFRAVPYYLSLIDWNDPEDPIRRQCIPDMHELDDAEAGGHDPYGEISTSTPPGVVHRFADRVLLVAMTTCSVYCRHCTRKNTLDTMSPFRGGGIDLAVDYITRHPEVREVLISGGDPFLLDAEPLDDLLGRLQAIPHVEVLRIGTRVPVVLPMRVDAELVAVLRRHRPVWVNTQFNHPRELTEEAVASCRKLIDAGIPVSNQSVLLKGINDELNVMRALCAGLQRNLIRPYYVFECDPIAGIAHFRTDPAVGGGMEHALRGCLGGLCIPRFVADVPGQPGKTPLAASQEGG